MRIRQMLFPFGIATGLGAVMLAVPLAQAGQAPACDDCKFQKCLQSEISRSEKMREMYRRAGAAKTMDEYQKTVDAEGDKILAAEQAALGNNPDCQTKFPDLNDMVEQKRWRALGWGIEFDKDKKAVGARFSAATKIEGDKCTLRQSQLDKLKEILPCLAIANATEAHERNHVEQCGHAIPKTPREMAAYEVKGYNAELQVLNDAKRKLDRKCDPRASGSEPDMNERYAQRERLRRAVNRVSSYAATI